MNGILRSPALMARTLAIVAAVLTLFVLSVVAHVIPVLVLQIGMFVALSGSLAWPPWRSIRTGSTWFLWGIILASLVARLL